MAAEKPNRAAVAMDLEDAAASILSLVTDDQGFPKLHDEAVAVAQVQATLALGQRVADLTDVLEAGLQNLGHAVGVASGT